MDRTNCARRLDSRHQLLKKVVVEWFKFLLVRSRVQISVWGQAILSFSWFTSAPQSKIMYSALKLGDDRFLVHLSYLSFTYHPFVRLYIGSPSY
jgi:hypothetical protein